MVFTKERQSLIFDADDTLWENNIYFEAAFDQFLRLSWHSAMTPAEMRAVLDEIEIGNIRFTAMDRRTSRAICSLPRASGRAQILGSQI